MGIAVRRRVGVTVQLAISTAVSSICGTQRPRIGQDLARVVQNILTPASKETHAVCSYHEQAHGGDQEQTPKKEDDDDPIKGGGGGSRG